jgi:hypothetical protein
MELDDFNNAITVIETNSQKEIQIMLKGIMLMPLIKVARLIAEQEGIPVSCISFVKSKIAEGANFRSKEMQNLYTIR